MIFFYSLFVDNNEIKFLEIMELPLSRLNELKKELGEDLFFKTIKGGNNPIQKSDHQVFVKLLIFVGALTLIGGA